MMAFIDPPSPFAPLEEWQAFLEEMQSVETRTPQIQEAIDEAKAMTSSLEIGVRDRSSVIK